MLVKVLISFWEGETHYEKGNIYRVSENIGHGLLEKGIARKVYGEMKELEVPPKDKMMSKGRKKLRTK